MDDTLSRVLSLNRGHGTVRILPRLPVDKNIRIVNNIDYAFALIHGTMNAFTASCHTAVIRSPGPDTAYVDACDANTSRFGSNIPGS